MTTETPARSAAKLQRAADLQVSIAMASVGFYVTSMGAVLAILATEFSVAPESLSWVGSTFGMGLLVIAATGRLLLRKGPRPALAGSAVALATGSGLVALAPNLALVFIGAILQGLGAAVMVLVAPVMLSENADVRLTRANGVASLIGAAAPLLLGAAAGIGIGGRLPVLVLLPVLLWLLWTLLRFRTANPDQAAPIAAWATTIKPSKLAVLRRWLVVVTAVSVEFCYVVWGVSRLRDTGLDTSLAAILGVAFPAGMAVGRLGGAWLMQRLPAVPFGVAIGVLGTGLVVFSDGWPLVALGLVVAGIGVATLYPVTLAGLMAVPRLNPAVGASLGALASGTAIVLAPVGLATIATVVDLRWAFLISIPLLLLLLVLYGRPERPSTPG